MAFFRRPSILPACVSAVCLSTAGAVAGAGAHQDTIARTAYVTVLDEHDAPVPDLTAAEIVILEDDAPRAVTAVAPAAEPLAIALLVDTAKPRMGDQFPTRDVRAGLSTFVKIVQTASPTAKIAVMDTGGAAVMIQDFTDRTADLTRAINRLIASQRSSAVVLEALVDAGKAIGRQASARRAVVSIDFDSQDTSGVQGNDIAQAIQGAGACVWAISIRGPGGTAMREAGLDAITEMSGGLRLTAVAASALEQKLQIVARALASQYLVTYERPGGSAVRQVRAVASRGSKVLATRIIVK